MLANAVPADTYKCDAVDDLARLGYDGTQSVSIVGENKVCKFSIGGASADGISPRRDFLQDQIDNELLNLSPEDFISQRLVSIVLASANNLDEPARFVVDNIGRDEDLSKLSCSDSGTLSVRDLEIRCIIIDDAKPESPQVFENGIITAVLFGRKFIFEIKSITTSETAMLIFIPKL